MTGKKIKSIQALRGMAILLVLARHIFVMEGKFGGGEMFLPSILRTGDSGVDIFFVISGFIMVVISRGRFQMPAELGMFLYKRVTRIYPLYWLYSLVILGLFLAAPELQKTHSHLAASLLLLPQSVTPLLGQGWTLVHEVYFYVVFSFALLLPEKQLSRFLLLWGLLVAAGYNMYLQHPLQLGSATVKLITNPITIEFVLGACIALAVQRGAHRGGWWCLIGGSLLLPASLLFFDPLEFEGLRFFCYGLPALLILYGAVTLEKEGRFQLPRWLGALGDVSYSIYLSHILVITAVGRMWSKVQHPGLWDNALAVIVMAGGAVACGIASYRWIELPLLRICQGWITRRRTALYPENTDLRRAH
jgi:exopolysaccharide production protein ExoZ